MKLNFFVRNECHNCVQQQLLHILHHKQRIYDNFLEGCSAGHILRIFHLVPNQGKSTPLWSERAPKESLKGSEEVSQGHCRIQPLRIFFVTKRVPSFFQRRFAPVTLFWYWSLRNSLFKLQKTQKCDFSWHKHMK